jgi:hypothetical protein
MVGLNGVKYGRITLGRHQIDYVRVARYEVSLFRLSINVHLVPYLDTVLFKDFRAFTCEHVAFRSGYVRDELQQRLSKTADDRFLGALTCGVLKFTNVAQSTNARVFKVLLELWCGYDAIQLDHLRSTFTVVS